MVNVLPGIKFSGDLKPIVIFRVCPAPSGLRISFSIVTPSEISALNWSSVRSLLPILTEISSDAGASNNPGISSVSLIALIGEEPSFLIVITAVKSCLL